MRSYWKGPYFNTNLINSIFAKRAKHLKQSKQLTFYTRDRSSTILEALNNNIVALYNGKKYFHIKMRPEYVGYKLGELVYTKKTAVFKKKRNKKKKNFKK